MSNLAKYKFEPDYAVHPGELLREYIDVRLKANILFAHELWLMAEYFRKKGRSLDEVLICRDKITKEDAQMLSKIMLVHKSLWINLQRAYDEYEAKEKNGG